MASDDVFGQGFGLIQARTRYEAMRSTPWIVDGISRGELLGVYSGVDVRKAPKRLSDLSYVVMPAGDLARAGGRVVDSVILREAMPGQAGRNLYVEAGGRRLRASASAAGMVARLDEAEVEQVCHGPALAWQVGESVWRVLALEAKEFTHPPLVVVTGRPAAQAVWAVSSVSAWEASLVALLVRARGGGERS